MKMLPPLLEHPLRRSMYLRAWLDRSQQRFKLALNVRPTNGLAVAFTAALGTEIIGVAAHPPSRPTRRQRCVAMSAQHEPSEWKIFIQVGALRCSVYAIEAVL